MWWHEGLRDEQLDWKDRILCFLVLVFISSSSFYCLTWDTQSRRNAASGQSAVFLPAAAAVVGWLGSYTGGTLGKKTHTKRHLLTVQVAHIRPLCHKVPQTPVRPSSDASRYAFSMSDFFGLIFLFSGKRKGKKSWIFFFFKQKNECRVGGWVWKETMIKSLSCRDHRETSGCMCDSPTLHSLSLLSLTHTHSQTVSYVFFLIPGCSSGKQINKQTKKTPPSTPWYVPQWHFTLCARVSVSVSCLRGWLEISSGGGWGGR